MTVLPFICLAIGIALGLFVKSKKFPEVADKISTVALIFLMLSIGVGIGLDKSIIESAPKIGFNCVVIAIFALGFSVLFTVICEKTVLPLKKLDEELKAKELGLEQPEDEGKTSHLVWIMPVSVIIGLAAGIAFRGNISSDYVDMSLWISLIILYICVGVSQGANKEVFVFLKMLGVKVIWLSVAILLGSLVGGILSGLVLGLPFKMSLVSSSGMSFYSLTGAFMTKTFGLEVGTYGFIVNILRELITIITMPLLIKLSPGSPIAGGAAGCMDTMLAPVTKFVGVRLGLVTLITGTILTFIVPFLLPLLSLIV